MAKDEQTIKKEIKEYIDKCGGLYSEWYVGIAEDARERLFGDHNVDEDNGSWIYRQSTSAASARRVEEYFIEELGTDGGRGGGNENSDYVYAYKKSAHTVEE